MAIENNQRNQQYVLKVHMTSGTFTVGPYREFESAKQDMFDIGDGVLTTLETQRGTTVYISGVPDAVELMSFIPKPRQQQNRPNGRNSFQGQYRPRDRKEEENDDDIQDD